MIKKNDLTDTIVAIATSAGEAGIGIVRISGKDALKVADRIFTSKSGKPPSTWSSHTVRYGWIVHACGAAKQIIDEVLLLVMRAPRTYTRENSVEINCHGGQIALRRVLELALEQGCRLADPGEFTKRAFLNGRIDLSQAEAVLDIVRAKTDFSLRVGLEQLRGGLSGQIQQVRSQLLDILSPLEAAIDFPEDGIPAMQRDISLAALSRAQQQLRALLERARLGRIVREGIRVVICGKPNVGKSSLLNALLKQERAIVTPIAGTTRDVIEEIIDIRGIPVRIMDTAGLLEPRDLVERKAVARTKACISDADVVIAMFDASKSLSAVDRQLMRRLRRKKTIAVLNKIDLKKRLTAGSLAPAFPCAVELSARTMRNIRALEDAIAATAGTDDMRSPESILVSNLRHIHQLKAAEKLIAESIDSLHNNISVEYVAQSLKDALACFDILLGATFTEDMLDRIFGSFCIGK
ncbi:MAG TPA: tRNA uridine-5-carboxymethylaminomethyl(34) synthesis GTPase MnmE [Candidatus Omnitrophota bacterium]|nr:tRNA uridine-5-carboxymethylaminomethyl(34) synthesis GTPase MnmE [Candidatus Omnitrophota bacterium]